MPTTGVSLYRLSALLTERHHPNMTTTVLQIVSAKVNENNFILLLVAILVTVLPSDSPKRNYFEAKLVDT